MAEVKGVVLLDEKPEYNQEEDTAFEKIEIKNNILQEKKFPFRKRQCNF